MTWAAVLAADLWRGWGQKRPVAAATAQLQLEVALCVSSGGEIKCFTYSASKGLLSPLLCCLLTGPITVLLSSSHS